MKQVWKKIICGVMIAGMAFSMVSCGEPSTGGTSVASGETSQPSTAKPVENVKLTWWVANTVTSEEQKLPQDQWYITGFINRFKEAHPGVEIEITLQSDGMQTLQDFKAAAVANNGPDIVELFSGPNMLSVKEGLLPLNSYITDEERSALVGWNTVSEDLDETKNTYGYPYPAQSAVMMGYNKEILKNAGYDLEANPPKTMDELEAIFQALVEKDILPIHIDESFPTYFYYIMAYGWVQNTGTDGLYQHTAAKTSYLEDKGFMNMLTKYQDYYKKGFFNVDTATSADSINSFMQGGCAFYPVGAWDFPNLTEALGDKIGILPIPSFTADGKPGMIGGIGAGLSVANYSKNADLAVEMVKSLVSRDELIKFYQVSSGVPMRTDISIQDIGRQDDPLLSTVVAASDSIVYWADNCMSAESAAICAQFASQVLVGNMTPQELAQKMDEAQQ